MTAWEVLSLCRLRPFALLTDVEVIQNAEHLYYNSAMQVRRDLPVTQVPQRQTTSRPLPQLELIKPDTCEKDVWDLLEECWNRDEQSRPTFAEISLFLKRKTIAFDVKV